MEQEHIKKMVAPVFITVFLVLYEVGFLVAALCFPLPFMAKLILGLCPLPFMGVSIYVLAERVKEIRSGEEDNLSEY